MIYTDLQIARFVSRPNRFVATVELNGRIETVHVKNTGRCRELLLPGAEVYLETGANPSRKTKYDLVAVKKGSRVINMDSQAPNIVFYEHLQSGKFMEGLTLIKPETKYGSSRFDFYAEAGGRKLLMEVKGVTLEENGIVLFPDAPTERGVRHLKELTESLKDGYEAYAIFIIQMSDVTHFTPNRKTHPAFADALAAAKDAGVKVIALDCFVTPDSLCIKGEVPVIL